MDAWSQLNESWTTKVPPKWNSYFCKTVYVIVGKGSTQIAFPIRKIVLEQSPVIKTSFWHPYTLPPDIIKRGENMYFESHSPDVVKGILFCLLSRDEGMSDLLPRGPLFWREISDPTYFVRFYFLAASLG